MANRDCPYCRQLEAIKTQPADELLWAFPYSVALLGPWQYYHGYCILVSRRHATELSQLSDPERLGYFEEMCHLARVIEQCFGPHKLNYEILGNQVGHLHWHLFPRYANDPDVLKPVWLALDHAGHNDAETKRLQSGPQDRSITRRLIRDALRRDVACTPADWRTDFSS